MFATTIRRLAITTFAGFAAMASATPAAAQSSASEAAVVRVEVVAAPPAPVTRAMDATWNRAATGASSTWRAEVEVEQDAVITLVPGEGAQNTPVRASLTVREFAGAQLAEVELTAADESAPAEMPVTLRIER